MTSPSVQMKSAPNFPQPPDANHLLLGLKATLDTDQSNPVISCLMALWVVAFQSVIVESSFPDANNLPSELKATLLPEPKGNVSVLLRGIPISILHSIRVLSSLPEAMILPSGLKTTF